MLRLLESKGHLRHEQDGPRYVYFPTADPNRVSKSAVQHLVRTFFDNSASSAVAAMVGMYEDRWSDEDLAVMEKAWIEVLAEESAKDPLFKKVADHYLNYRKQFAVWGTSQQMKTTYQK